MRFMGSKQSSSSQNDPSQFFITENIDQGRFDHRGLHPDSEIEERHHEEEEDQQDEKEEEEKSEVDFDFGRAKMDFFKKRAKEILLEKNSEEEEEPTGQLSLANAYKNLKAALRNPVVIHATTSDEKPHYMKMTFSMCRNAVNGGEKFLELSKMKSDYASSSL
mmetsp:Transcript_20055/g.14762  ORF Transcript_20055/g.14762 Transcript_20055/m.14762 type:complete len:163 (+) Transcript_20055:490-978(+)